MIFLKSITAGLVVVVAAAVVSPVFSLVGILIYNSVHPTPNNISVGWNPMNHVRQPSLAMIAFSVICFWIGFLWEYHKLTHPAS